VTTDNAPWWVICLCAAWCGVCRDWQPAFEREALAQPGVRFAWVDVEDHAQAMGEVDIETFPTLLVAHGQRVLFMGPVPPAGPQLARLLGSLRADPAPLAGVGEPEQALFARLKSAVLPHFKT
jgi:thioredoxin 1